MMTQILSHAGWRAGGLVTGATAITAVMFVAMGDFGPRLTQRPVPIERAALPTPIAERAVSEAARSNGIALSGSAEMGVVGSGPTHHHSVDTEFSGTGETDSGLSFGADVADLSTLQNTAPASPAVRRKLLAREAIPAATLPTDPPTSEVFSNAASSSVTITTDTPVSTFSVDVDTASWSVIRSSLAMDQLPPAQAVRIEEMVNYFSYDYPMPERDAAFRTDFAVVETPWNPDTRLLRIGLQGRVVPEAERPPLNLVLLIDTSGSMNQPNKLPLLQRSLRRLLPELRAEDEVAIVTYAGSAGLVLPPTNANERSAIEGALAKLHAGGGTAGQAGLTQAYDVARQMRSEGEVTRVILATDGDFNIGPSDPEALKASIAQARSSGVYLSVLGFGRGNLDDATMQALAQNGNGIAAYIDTAREARKVLVDQVASTLVPIADDVKVQVEFNPAAVAEYRLIGYETRALRREDFNNDAVDAGDVGAGHQVTALYEITAPDSPARLNDALVFQPNTTADDGDDAWVGQIRLRWKAPGAADSTLVETLVPNETTDLDQETGFAAAIAGFGQMLTDGAYVGTWGYDQAISLALKSRGEDPFGLRNEAVQMMRDAQSLRQE